MQDTPISLTEFNLQIKQEMKKSFPHACWIVAEISELRGNYSGHCYLELVDKTGSNDSITARMRATIWSFTYKVLSPYFESATGQKLAAGMKVLVKAQPQFHELYGISLNIVDINPAYTLGEQQRKRQEIIAKLEREGLTNRNKEIKLPVVIQKIAVISSKTAAGYGDFINQLEKNQYNLKFYCKLFHSVMQGESASASVVSALEKIMGHREHFDAIVIIRGGGAAAELSCFDDYTIGSRLATSPLPVIAGIGHERDETVVDLVAHTRVKTPTAAGEFLIAHNRQFEQQINEAYAEIVAFARNTLHYNQQQLKNYTRILPAVANGKLEKSILDLDRKSNIIRYQLPEKLHKIERSLERYRRSIALNLQTRTADELKKLSRIEDSIINNAKSGVKEEQSKLEHIQQFVEHRSSKLLAGEKGIVQGLEDKLKNTVHTVLEGQKHRLKLAEVVARNSDPANVLKKGFSITQLNGKLLTEAGSVQDGDELRTKLYDGEVVSIVKK